MLKFMLIYLFTINAAGILVMYVDKQNARNNLRRIPEASLMAVAVMGGSIGCLIGMYRFHHKTRKPKFRYGIPAILAVQLVLGVLRPLG